MDRHLIFRWLKLVGMKFTLEGESYLDRLKSQPL